MTPIIDDRLAILNTLHLKRGRHDAFDAGACVMEAVAYVAGEDHSDHPACACPVITSFLVSWNDALPSDEDRDRLLKPLVPLIIDTRSSTTVEVRRSFMAYDWLVRVQTPSWLSLAGLSNNAAALRGLPEIMNTAGIDAALAVLTDARTNAAAAWDAAGDAARAAVRDAVRDAARDAAGDAVRAAARAAAWDAAWDAAGDAAGDAARAAIAPTVTDLQASAIELVHRMIGAHE